MRGRRDTGRGRLDGRAGEHVRAQGLELRCDGRLGAADGLLRRDLLQRVLLTPALPILPSELRVTKLQITRFCVSKGGLVLF